MISSPIFAATGDLYSSDKNLKQKPNPNCEPPEAHPTHNSLCLYPSFAADVLPNSPVRWNSIKSFRRKIIRYIQYKISVQSSSSWPIKLLLKTFIQQHLLIRAVCCSLLLVFPCWALGAFWSKGHWRQWEYFHCLQWALDQALDKLVLP